MSDLADLYRRHFEDVGRERALLSAVGFTGTFAIARGVTHAIRAGVGPFQNLSAGGTHIHHSTFGICGLLAIGFAWTHRRRSRSTSSRCGSTSRTTIGVRRDGKPALQELGLLPKLKESAD